MDNQPKYFIRSYERGYWHNSPVWWGPNQSGYTAYLDQAGQYTYEQACAICRCDPATGLLRNGKQPGQDGDWMYRADALLAIAHKIVDTQDFSAANVKGGK